MWGQILEPVTIGHWYIGFGKSGIGEQGMGTEDWELGTGDWEPGTGNQRMGSGYWVTLHLFTIFFTETYQILTRIMSDVATEVYNFSDYANNPSAYTYGNIYNTFSYDTEQDFKRTLDYIVFRKPRMQHNLDIKVLDYR